MADRTVKVTLIANATGYIAGMDTAARKTRELGSEAERLAQKRAAFEGIGRGLLAIGVAAAIGVGFAISKFVEFDQAMSQVSAVTQETASNMDLLRDAALEAGGRTVYTATEAANAIEELGKAGLATSTILSGALDGSLDLAAAGNLEVARSAEIVATTLQQYSLRGADAARVTDVLAAAAGKSLAEVDELAESMKYAGPVAAAMGISVEDTAAALALFADNGLRGEQAGTSLRGVLASLTSPSKEAQKELDRLGVTLYDTNGQFLGLENVAGELQGALGGLTDAERDMALGLIFGNQQVTAARVLVKGGATDFREYRDAVDETGYASRVAADRLDNLAGDVEKLGGAFDTALIQSGSGANDVLRGLVQTATFLVDAIGGAPEPVLAVGLAFTVAAAGVTLFSGAALLLIPRLADLRQWMSSVGLSAGGLAVRLASATAAITAVTLVIGLFAADAAAAAASSDAFADSLDKASGASTDYTRSLAVQRLEQERAFELADKAGVSQEELTDALLEGGEAWDEITQRLTTYADTQDTIAPLQRQQALRIRDIRSELENGIEAWKNETEANRGAARATEANERALAALEGRAGSAQTEIDGLSDSIRNFGQATLSTRDAERQFQDAIDAATESFSEYGATLDRGTDAGRANEASLDAIVRSAREVAAARYEETQSTEAATKAIQDGRDALIAQLAQYGIVGAEAEAYADSLGLIPSNVNTFIDINVNPALAALETLRARLAGNQSALNSLNNWRPQGFSYGNFAGNMYVGGQVQAFASGGFASGIYGGVRGGIHKFAESEMGVPWETYISGRPQDRGRNIGIWEETGRRLGAWQTAPQQYATAPSSGPTTALVDPGLTRAVLELARAHRATLNTVGLSEATDAGSARRRAVGAE